MKLINFNGYAPTIIKLKKTPSYVYYVEIRHVEKFNSLDQMYILNIKDREGKIKNLDTCHDSYVQISYPKDKSYKTLKKGPEGYEFEWYASIEIIIDSNIVCTILPNVGVFEIDTTIQCDEYDDY